MRGSGAVWLLCWGGEGGGDLLSAAVVVGEEAGVGKGEEGGLRVGVRWCFGVCIMDGERWGR